MKEKRKRNVLKNAIWDYYLTNRAITKEYDEEYKKTKPGKFNKREKMYVAVIVIGSLLLLIKYFVL
jgi:hypothetical protein